MIIIIGSGLAGYNLARELRTLDKSTPITMITQDAGHFYSKPQLSTSLANNKTAEDLMNTDAESMAEKLGINILTHTKITQIDSTNHQIHTSQPENNVLNYEKLVLAVGANTPTPPMLGNPEAIEKIFYINDVYQYRDFRKKLQPHHHVTVIGAGLVGCEFANDLTIHGHKVACVDPAPTALSLLVPKIVSEPLEKNMQEQGVTWHLGQVIKSLDYAEDHANSESKKIIVTLDNNITFETDVVISAIGLRPRVTLAQDAGIETNKGIVVDPYLETNIKNIYALGDCAEINGWTLPYVAPIMQAAKALAKTLTGEHTAMQFPAMPVNIKTTCYPVTICCPPNADKNSQWEFNQDPETQAVRGYLKNKSGKTIGFILTQEATKERMGLLKDMDNWL